MLVAQARMSSQLRKSPSWTRMAEVMTRSGKLRCFFTSLPVKIWWSRALVLWRIVLTSTGLSAGLAGSPTGPLENSQTGRAASAAGLALCQLTSGFHPPAHIDRAAQHHGVELFHRAVLGEGNHRDIQALPGQHIGDRLGDLTG